MNRKLFLFALALIVCYLSYVFNTPVPSNMTQPWRYRLIIAGVKGADIIAAFLYLTISSEPFGDVYFKTTRFLLDVVAIPPQNYVRGSNIKSRVTYFDGVNVRLYEPIESDENALQPGFVFIHGGGMSIGSSYAYDRLTRKIAEELNMVLISIDYRLSPEHPYPAGITDCLTATKFFMRHARDYGVDPTRIAIGGDSAGGSFSAVVAQVIHDDDTLPDLKVQVLMYPTSQMIDTDTPSYQKYKHDFGDNAGPLAVSTIAISMNLYVVGTTDPHVKSHLMTNNHTSPSFKKTSEYRKYVDHAMIPDKFKNPTYYKPHSNLEYGNDDIWAQLSPTFLDPLHSPLMRHNLTGLPQAYIITCGFDALRDDGIFYAKRLRKAGVNVTWKHYEGAFHGILSVNGSPLEFTLGTTIQNAYIFFIKRNI